MGNCTNGCEEATNQIYAYNIEEKPEAKEKNIALSNVDPPQMTTIGSQKDSDKSFSSKHSDSKENPDPKSHPPNAIEEPNDEINYPNNYLRIEALPDFANEFTLFSLEKFGEFKSKQDCEEFHTLPIYGPFDIDHSSYYYGQ